MKKIGIMGGTFDPIHIGHLTAAESAREACRLDEVWFIPAAAPPLKNKTPGASARNRYEMTQLATEGNPFFKALDMELRREGVSYSIDTVQQLKDEHPGCSFSFIIGSDRVNDLPKWHRIRELADSVDFIGLERPSDPLSTEGLPSYLKERLRLIDMPPIGISSTELRECLATGTSVRYLVPDSVYAYIRRNRLYGSATND
ncbi:nicotinate-nucleotide adenylyltransferase [Paenibacillus sp. GCM10027627]|uniref:nicotinate-nucleotide adenylyltransferase n=1 Tax=unclassified Paenibacillus TaxID=185978 RepID=UPI0036348457